MENGDLMKDIIQIHLTNPENKSLEVETEIHSLFQTIIAKTSSEGILDKTITAIVITDDFKGDIEVQSKQWNIVNTISQEKDSIVVSKTLFNHDLLNPEHKIFIHYGLLRANKTPIIRVIYAQILKIYTRNLLPDNLKEIDTVRQPDSLSSYILLASIDWCQEVYTQFYLNQIKEFKTEPINQNSFLIAFKRRLKKFLFENMSDKMNRQERLDQFWLNYYQSMHTLFLRIIENKTSDINFLIKDDEPCKPFIYNIINEIEIIAQGFIDKKYNLDKLTQAIKDFSSHFEVFLDEGDNNNISIKLTKNPKDYFVGEIIETEPRIICFMDILGFKELIDNYDADITSTLLQDIQESFSLAMSNLTNGNDSIENKNVLKHLQHQTFSDNISISIPYFDNEDDFLANFNLLTVYVRGFQLIMMNKGFFTRGGISIGSYYADKNIIFSKGLVTAYEIESKKAIYPRVVIDTKIIEKIINYNHSKIIAHGLGKAIIHDWENTSFLNPFRQSEHTIEQVKSLINQYATGVDIADELRLITEKLGVQTIRLLENSTKEELKNMELIKEKIAINAYRNKDKESIFSKYKWLYEFILWLEEKPEAKLKFTYIAEFLKTDKK